MPARALAKRHGHGARQKPDTAGANVKQWYLEMIAFPHSLSSHPAATTGQNISLISD